MPDRQPTTTRTRAAGGPAVPRRLSDDVRPLTARSLVLSVLLGLPEPRLRTSSLIRLADVFDLAPGTVRTALSRLTAAGDLVNHDGVYELRGRLLERKTAQDIGRRPPDDAWDGDWWIVAVTAPRRSIAERRQFRTAMVNARLGELRPDTWLRPANLPGPHVERGVATVRGPLAGEDHSALVARLWDLPAIARRSHTLLAALDEATTEVRGAPNVVLPTAMTLAAVVVRFLRREPMLPQALTPADWPVDELRRRYRSFDHHFGRSLHETIGP